MSTCLGGRCEACAPPKGGPFLLRHQLIALSAIGRGRGSFLQVCPPNLPGVPVWHGAGSPIILGGCSQGSRHLRLHHRSRAGDPGAPSLPWQGTLRVLVPQDGDKVAFHLPADRRVPHSPHVPLPRLPPLPAHAFARGLEAGSGGGGNTGWSESEPGICRMSPYPDSLCFPVSISTVLLQPPAGGWQGASLGGGDLATPLTPCSLPFLPCCPRDARAWAINRGRCSSSLGARGDPGARSFVTPHHTVCFHRASVSPPRCSCGAGGMLGLVPPQPRR